MSGDWSRRPGSDQKASDILLFSIHKAVNLRSQPFAQSACAKISTAELYRKSELAVAGQLRLMVQHPKV